MAMKIKPSKKMMYKGTIMPICLSLSVYLYVCLSVEFYFLRVCAWDDTLMILAGAELFILSRSRLVKRK